jgi:hypothetical protein
MGLLWACLCACAFPGDGAAPESFLYQPAYCLDEVLRVPTEPYCPQPGDIFLATDHRFLLQLGHWLAGGAGVQRSGIVIAGPDGSLALLEAGPCNNEESVCISDLIPQMQCYLDDGEKVWIRRRCVPLTCEQSTALTTFALAQEGKPFATVRVLGQLSLLRSRGPLRTCFIGKPRGDRCNWFCSELVMECCVAAGLLDAATVRPAATYPRDLFFGRSHNPYLDRHLPLEETGWCPPARWLPAQRSDTSTINECGATR